ncbi:hypothetical protein BDN72DRAFT_863172 [Pluteus cervinus]|uniref:Uncharacterized protein n=1 Tax=Pluteus cervinus TaxID=181527 RepID=A0ACD3A8D9_9AGAR|nr:hypothetical protein BDN72DRAFT_863172 [Pluteus cervinus]
MGRKAGYRTLQEKIEGTKRARKKREHTAHFKQLRSEQNHKAYLKRRQKEKADTALDLPEIIVNTANLPLPNSRTFKSIAKRAACHGTRLSDASLESLVEAFNCNDPTYDPEVFNWRVEDLEDALHGQYLRRQREEEEQRMEWMGNKVGLELGPGCDETIEVFHKLEARRKEWEELGERLLTAEAQDNHYLRFGRVSWLWKARALVGLREDYDAMCKGWEAFWVLHQQRWKHVARVP